MHVRVPRAQTPFITMQTSCVARHATLVPQATGHAAYNQEADPSPVCQQHKHLMSFVRVCRGTPVIPAEQQSLQRHWERLTRADAMRRAHRAPPPHPDACGTPAIARDHRVCTARPRPRSLLLSANCASSPPELLLAAVRAGNTLAALRQVQRMHLACAARHSLTPSAAPVPPPCISTA